MNQYQYINFDKLKGRLSKRWIENLRFINYLLNEDKPQIITHNDPDGLISGLLLKNYFVRHNIDPIVIPISYNELKLPEFRQVLTSGKYLAIADLPPFNNKKCDIYIDHHDSIDQKKINATRIYYDGNAPSAAYIIKNNLDIINHDLRYLADLTVLTDTGDLQKHDFPTDMKAPTSKVDDAWYLEDIVYANRDVKHLIKILELLEEYKSIKEIIPYFKQEIQDRRNHRRKSLKKAERISLNSNNMIVLIFKTRKYQAVTILDFIRQKNVKVVIGLVRSMSKSYKMYARHSFNLSKKEEIKYRLDKLSESFGGGGHISAAGAQVTGIKKTINSLEAWGSQKGLKTLVHIVK